MNHKTQQAPHGVYWGNGAKGGVGVGQSGTEMEGKRKGEGKEGEDEEGGRRRGEQVGGACFKGEACTCIESPYLAM